MEHRIYWERRLPAATRSRLRRAPLTTRSPAMACRRDAGAPSESMSHTFTPDSRLPTPDSRLWADLPHHDVPALRPFAQDV